MKWLYKFFKSLLPIKTKVRSLEGEVTVYTTFNERRKEFRLDAIRPGESNIITIDEGVMIRVDSIGVCESVSDAEDMHKRLCKHYDRLGREYEFKDGRYVPKDPAA